MNDRWGVTHELAHFVNELDVHVVPQGVRERTKILLLDALVCAMAAGHSDDMEPVAAVVDAIDSDGSSTIIGRTGGKGLAAAVLSNAFRITAMTACDVYYESHSHMTPEVVPAALAIAERDACSGSELLKAMVAGLETSVRVSDGLDTAHFRRHGWHPPGIVGPFGGAAAVASLLGLDTAHTRNALAIAGSQAAGTWASRGTATMKFHQAHGAVSGLLGGLLGSEGLDGARDVLGSEDGGLLKAFADGGDPEAIIADLGTRWGLEKVSIRPWPGGGRVQPSISAAFDVAASAGFEWARVSEVVVRVPQRTRDAQAAFDVPETLFEALASIKLGVFLMLANGRLELADYQRERFQSPEVRRVLTDRIRIESDEGLHSTGASVEVIDIEGERWEAEVSAPMGHWRRPTDWAGMRKKAHQFADETLGTDGVDELVEEIRRLEDCRDVRGLLQLVTT